MRCWPRKGQSPLRILQPGTEAFAPAKLNLALHVTGRREDGYHLLDSLVVFAGTGDRVTLRAADDLTLSVTGPQAHAVPAGDDNLVLRAARLVGGGRGAAITLDKRLPVASGIGGGSADAAATLRAMAALHGLPLPGAAAVLGLGADVPVCLSGRPCRMAGVGEWIEPLAQRLPPVWVVLVNPGVPLSTPAVFRALQNRDNPPMEELPLCTDAAGLAGWLSRQRNDLEPPARSLVPELGAVLDMLGAQPGCLLARMSGSGATCFGLFAAADAADAAAAAIAAARPDWWAAAAPVLD
jgi:4-diphosphocytidyl-2-C-methyl-D-erythritol kinase